MNKVVPLEGFGGGGSSPLNFKIVAYATEEELMAVTPQENTIGVITTTPINGWIFGSEDPYEILISYQSQTCTVNSLATYFNNILTLNSTPTTGKSYIININGIEHSIIITNSTSESSEDGYIDLVPSGDGYTVRVNDVIESPCTIEMYSKKPENGFIWIANTTKGTISFNALKKNGIILYPLSAKQYIGDAWVDVIAKSYQNGEWIEWITYLYKNGNEFTNLTGDFSITYSNNKGTGTLTKNADSLYLYSKGSTGSGANFMVYTGKKINLTGFSTLYARIAFTNTKSTRIYLGVNSVNTAMPTTEYFFTTEESTDGIVTFDVSNIPGEYYVGIGVTGSAVSNVGNCYVYEVYLK